MAEHQKFEELCALAAGGHLNGPEYIEFHNHIQNCSECTSAYGELAALITKEIPHVQNSATQAIRTFRTKPISDSRQRFLRRARTEGIVFSREIDQKPASKWLHFRPLPALGTITALMALAAGLAAYQFRHAPAKSQAGQPNSQVIAQLTRERANLESSLIAEQNAESASRQEVVQLHSQVDSQAKQIAEFERKLDESKRQGQTLQTVQASLSDTQARVLSLQSQVRDKESQLAEANTELVRIRNAKDESDASLVAQQIRINELSDQLHVTKTSLDTERQLLAVGKDVRDIMGARQLHIVDVHDSDSSGKDRRAFGRIFYTEGKQLVFYAFDLNEAKVRDAKFSFQVWGQQESSKATPARSLGFLMIDDKNQKRWSLKVSDPNLLKEINSVFVTLEPGPGNRQPSGQRMLYGYLGDANHP